MRLTESQISSFHENGYLFLEQVLDTEDLQPVIDEYAAIIDERAQRLQNEGKVSSLYADEPFTRRLLYLAKETSEVAAGLDIMQARGEATFNFLKNPKILDVAESLVGSEILCNPIQHIRAILPQDVSGRGPTRWHQDAGVCWPDADPYFMLTMWIPIVDVTLESGCLQVMPGSHKYGLFNHVMATGTDVPDEDRPPIEPKPLCPSERAGLSCSIITHCIARYRMRQILSAGALTCVTTMPTNQRGVHFIPHSLCGATHVRMPCRLTIRPGVNDGNLR